MVLLSGLAYAETAPVEPTRALLLFNQYIVEMRPKIAPDTNVFLGAQLNVYAEAGAGAYSKCIPESNVFVIQLSVNASHFPPDALRVVAAHELCHVRIHKKFLCSAASTPGGVIPKGTHLQLERDAIMCSAEMLR